MSCHLEMFVGKFNFAGTKDLYILDMYRMPMHWNIELGCFYTKNREGTIFSAIF